jgi:hypothetical protein
MKGFLAAVHMLANGLAYIQPLDATDPGYGGGGFVPVDPGYGGGHPFPERPDQGLPGYGRPDQGLPGYGHPGNRPPGSWGGRPDQGLPIPPLRPSNPIVLPPGMWPPTLPPGPAIDNELPAGPPGVARPPIVIPPDPDLGIEHPIVLPELPPGTALLIALPKAQPKAGTPPNTAPAILVQPGKKPVLVYVSAAATPK